MAFLLPPVPELLAVSELLAVPELLGGAGAAGGAGLGRCVRAKARADHADQGDHRRERPAAAMFYSWLLLGVWKLG